MKYIMIVWMCINNPYFPIEDTCVEQSLITTFDTLTECRMAAEFIYNEVKEPSVYMTSFCAQKDLTTI